ncbi:MAG: radical SAM family heme chaperone HemW [Kiritimatiellaeota bacterium]|nr:radical SAM family heme chaperone HemW [Kiritimatiellota bacterium]
MFPHLYVHVPFCASKCRYCGFYSVAAGDGADSVPRLTMPYPHGEAPCATVQTVYIGGGTPTVLGAEGLSRLADNLKAAFPLGEVEEWTVEMNPSGVTPEVLDALRRMGANRVSIGVQSFCDDTLRRTGRGHSAEDAVRAVRMAQRHGFGNVGIDLIAGLPGVTQDEWQGTLGRALSLSVAHLSVYALSVEDGTPLARQVADGQCVLPDDEAQLDALALAEEALTRAGLGRYEISNYALPGSECRHNLGIWRGNDFLGLGPSAASRIGRERWTNPRSLDKTLPVTREQLDETDDALERVMFMLRLHEGFDPFAAAKRFPVLAALADTWEARLERLAQQGAVERGGLRWRLTPRGREVCDMVIRELIA